MAIYKKIPKRFKYFLAALALLLPSLIFIPDAFAAYLTSAQVILTNMDDNGSTSAVIVEFVTSASNTGTNGSLVFNGWTGSGGTGTVATSQTVANTYNSVNCESITGATANLPGSPTAAGTAGTGTIAITDSTALTASTAYCYVLPTAITATPTSIGSTTVAVTEGSDSALNVAIYIMANDQITVNAVVPPSFTLGLSGNTNNFTANLSSASIGTTTGVVATVNTNAEDGWYLWGFDSNTGLHSASQGVTIPSATRGSADTLTAGTAGYVAAVPTSSIVQGTGSAGTTSASTYFSSTGSGIGSGLDGTPRTLASSTGTANAAQVTVKEYAAISGVTPAASDYTDTVTLVGAGNF